MQMKFETTDLKRVQIRSRLRNFLLEMRDRRLNPPKQNKPQIESGITSPIPTERWGGGGDLERLDGRGGDGDLHLAPAQLLLRALPRALGGLELRRGRVGGGAQVVEPPLQIRHPPLCKQLGCRERITRKPCGGDSRRREVEGLRLPPWDFSAAKSRMMERSCFWGSPPAPAAADDAAIGRGWRGGERRGRGRPSRSF